MPFFQIEFKDNSLEELQIEMDKFYLESLLNEAKSSNRIGLMLCSLGTITIHLYAKEHPPPHFHVKYGNLENSYRINNCEPIYKRTGLEKYYKIILKWYRSNKNNLIRFWNENRPGNCPVGEFHE